MIKVKTNKSIKSLTEGRAGFGNIDLTVDTTGVDEEAAGAAAAAFFLLFGD